jgi:hypothetical protein
MIISAILGSLDWAEGAARAKSGAGWRVLCQASALRRMMAAVTTKKPAATAFK